MIIFNLLVTW